MVVNVEVKKEVSDIATYGWKKAGVAKLSQSKKSVNIYVDDRYLVLNVADLFELISGNYVSMDLLEHV